MSRFIGAIGMGGTLGGVVLLLVFAGVIDGEGDRGNLGTLLLAIFFLAIGIPALIYRIRDIFST